MLVLAAAEGDAEGLSLAVWVDDEVLRLVAGEKDPEEEYLPFAEPDPPRASRNAWAPNDTRLAKGEVGWLADALSLSSTASS